MNNVNIIKVKMDYMDDLTENSLILEGENGIVDFYFPDFGGYTAVCFIDDEGRSYETTLEIIKKIESSSLDNEENEQVKMQLPFLYDENGEMTDTFNFVLDENIDAVTMTYSDNTEEYMLHFAPMQQDDIENKGMGIWIYHGIRLLCFSLKNTEDIDADVTYQLVFDKLDNVHIDPVIKVTELMEKTAPEGEKCYIAEIDTNQLGNAMIKIFPDKHSVQCSGYLELTYAFRGYAEDRETKKIYVFPVRLMLINTSLNDTESSDSILDVDHMVSIDFGTSSTCVAIDDGEPYLLRLTNLPEDMLDETQNAFENPTMIQLYNWERLYKQWQAENQDAPLMRKHHGENEFSDDAHTFDFGYEVKARLVEADRRNLASILTELKLIPNEIAKGRQDFVMPFDTSRKQLVYLVDEPKNEKNDSLDPVAFYGYILGRAINQPSNGRIFTRYMLTFPVKFDESVREKLRSSIEYGIRRSLPRPVRDMKDENGRSIFRLTMDYPEPVAYAGAVCDSEELSIYDEIPKLFAIFDFGGGTLDFSYGMYRPGDPDAEEDEMWDSIIEILGIDGDNTIGGERLINLISYWILSDPGNREILAHPQRGENAETENNQEQGKEGIPYILPEGERKPDFHIGLLQEEKTASLHARINTRRVNEWFSRPIFENKEFPGGGIENCSGSQDVHIDLLDYGGNNCSIKLQIDFDRINALVKERINKAVELFRQSLDTLFNMPQTQEMLKKYGIEDYTDIRIFLAGNTSRHPAVSEHMKRHFSNVFLIGAENEEDGFDSYKITPKTAVAIGQLHLNDYKVNMVSSVPFAWFVGKKKGPHIIPLIEKNTAKSEWVKVNPIRNGEIVIMYSYIVDTETKKNWKSKLLKFKDEDNGKMCYIRPLNSSQLEYIALSNGENPDNYTGTPENILLTE